VENIRTRESRISKNPVRDLLPFTFKWVFAGSPIMKPSRFLMLLPLIFEE
jgi:hypothetical protein